MATRAALLCLACVLLSACGGGGGGDSGGGSANNTPPPPVFAFTDANAVQAASYVLKPLEQLIPAESVVINAAAFMRVYGSPQWTISCSTTPPVTVTITYTDQDASGNVSVGDVINVPAEDCAGLRRKLTFTLTQIASTIDQVAGRLEVDIEVDGMKIVGAFDASLSFTPATSTVTWRIANAMVTVTQGGTTETVRLASGQFVFTQTGYTFSVTGGSVDSERLGGNYTFSTVTPLAGTPRRLPSSGELLLSTSGGSRVRVTPPATAGNVEEAVEYAVATTSSGTFGPTQQTVWTAIVRGLLFNWRPNEAPTLTSLTIQPSNPPPGASLWVSYNAQDINGDALTTTIEWRRNGTVVGDQQVLYISPLRNDQISVTVTVSDGRLSATATTSITIGNPPPTLTLTVTPSLPDTTADLTAVTNIVEPDGDPVTVTYEWKRGSTVLGTGATLPASATTLGDTVSLRVTASDGVSTVEATASVTIVDSPPRVTVVAPPTTVAHGTPVTFTATVTDADGDPVPGQLAFLLAYGPAGMTVDPDTGVVNWTPTGPMFDREMNVNWGIMVDGAAELGRGTLRVTDPTRDYPLMRFGTQIPVSPSGLSLADLDDDGDREMLIMGNRWLFEMESDGAAGYRQSWAYPYALNVDTQNYYQNRNALATGDIDGDRKHEIFAAAGRTITKLDGDERRAVATYQLAQFEACIDLALADLANDGDEELVCLTASDSYGTQPRILVLRASDLSLRHEYPQADYGRALTVGNVDGDAALEIVAAGGYVFDGASLANQWFFSKGFGIDVDTGNVDGSVDGVEEIVAAHDWEAVRIYRSGQLTQTPLAEVARSDMDSLLVADVAGNSRPEIIVGDGQGGYVTIYGYNTVTSGLDLIDQIGAQSAGVASTSVGNLDADAALEIVWGTGGGTTGPDVLVVAERDPTLAVEWQSNVQLDGPFRGGRLAGNVLEPRAPLFLSTATNSGYAGPMLVRMPSDGGDLELSATIGSGYSAIGSSPDVVDYDNDGDDEVFLAMGNSYYDPLFRVYDFFGDTDLWTSGTAQSQGSAIDVAHADVSGDGKTELIGLTSTGTVYVHNVFQQSLWWQSGGHTDGRRVLVGDVNGDPDGQPEIVVATSRNVYLYRHAPQPTAYVQAAAYQTNREILDAAVGDTDGDGEVEVLLLLGDPYAATGADVARLDNELRPLGSFTLPWSAISLAIEPSPTPRKNLLIGRMIGLIYYMHEGSLAIVDAQTGGIVFESPPLIGEVQRNSIQYVTLPGETRPRMSFGTSGGMYLTR